jgi:uncharacterized protein (DUF433 family)
LWTPQVPDVYGTLVLSFLDLVEVRFVDRFVSAGLSLRVIRLALDRAREVIGHSHPFSTRQFRTDGRSIFIEIADRADEPLVYDLVRNQYVFSRIVAPSFRDLEFEGNEPVRWWPLTDRRSVVVDPARAFGQPIVFEAGVPTASLAAAVEAEGSIQAVARWYEIDVRAVRDAVEFEQRLAA